MKIYNTTGWQLIVLWIFNVLILLFAFIILPVTDIGASVLLLIVLIFGTLAWYTIGWFHWRNEKFWRVKRKQHEKEKQEMGDDDSPYAWQHKIDYEKNKENIQNDKTLNQTSKTVESKINKSKQKSVFERGSRGEIVPTLRNKELMESLKSKYKSSQGIVDAIGIRDFSDFCRGEQFDPRQKTVFYTTPEQANKAAEYGAMLNKMDAEYLSEKETNRYKILLIESDKFIQEIYEDKFREAGFDFSAMSCGDLQKIKEYNPDLILLGVILYKYETNNPQKTVSCEDGFEFIIKLKDDPVTKDIPVIFLTNMGQKEDIERGMSLGAVDYLVSAHYTPNEVIARVRAYLERTKGWK